MKSKIDRTHHDAGVDEANFEKLFKDFLFTTIIMVFVGQIACYTGYISIKTSLNYLIKPRLSNLNNVGYFEKILVHQNEGDEREISPIIVF